MSGVEVICKEEMNYNGVQRFRGEIFRLIGAPNDDALVKVGYVRVIHPDEVVERIVDDSGRIFIDETARRNARSRMTPGETSIVVAAPRKRGRPPKNPAPAST